MRRENAEQIISCPICRHECPVNNIEARPNIGLMEIFEQQTQSKRLARVAEASKHKVMPFEGKREDKEN